MKPRARTDLVLRDLDDEAVIYDFTTNRAHCLNATALAVFRRADGATTVAELARRVSTDLGVSVDEDLVWMALAELDRANLLATHLLRKDNVDAGRRKLLKKMALTAGLSIAAPAVWSIVAPTPAYAATTVKCKPSNACMGAGTAGACCGDTGQSAMTCTYSTSTMSGTCTGAQTGACHGTCQ